MYPKLADDPKVVLAFVPPKDGADPNPDGCCCCARFPNVNVFSFARVSKAVDC